MPIAARLMDTILTGKFQFTKREGDHHFYSLRHANNRIRTKISHGETEIHDKNVSNMATQMKLTAQQLHEAVSCTLTRERYLEILDAAFGMLRPPTAPPHDSARVAAFESLCEAIAAMMADTSGRAAAQYEAACERAKRAGCSQQDINVAWEKTANRQD